MRITWLGHACFELAGSGAVVLTDPYDASVGYPVHPRRADIVTVSHDHYDHNDLTWTEAGAIFREPGIYSRDGVSIHGIPSFHDGFQGRKRGGNVIFKFDMDGLSLCHLGDLGHRLHADLIRIIGRVDVLLIPVGGTYTVDAEQALVIVRQLEPRLAIAMHYKTDVLSMPIEDEGRFLRLAGGVRTDTASVEVDREKLSGPMRVTALQYWR